MVTAENGAVVRTVTWAEVVHLGMSASAQHLYSQSQAFCQLNTCTVRVKLFVSSTPVQSESSFL